ncbi:MAG: O-antigen ligase family protein [Chloroflexia bacterium]
MWGADLPRIAEADVPPLGVNLFLDREPEEATIRRTLAFTRDMGAHWVKQLFPWEQIEPDAKGDFWDERYGRSTWEHYDRIVQLCQEYGLELIVRLDRPPPWARARVLASPRLQAALAEDPTRDITGPPDRLEDYGDYVYAVVSRYRGQVRYFQLWNEPNLANEWNWEPIDPERFVELLRIGYTRAKEANPEAVILFPSLAPNDGLDPRHMSDLEFLRRVYEAGGGAYFDIMSAQLYGLGQPPYERSPVGLDRRKWRLITRTDVSRVVLLREIMERYGDAGKAVWVGELGWHSTPAGWTGRPSIAGPSVSEETKGAYIVQALERSLAEWPWMGVRNIWFLRWGGPPPDPDDPTIFFQLVTYDFRTLPAYEAVRAWAASPLLGVGYHRMAGPTEWEGAFLGTRLDLLLPAGADPGALRVEVDGMPCRLRFDRREGAEDRYIAATRLADGRHTVRVGAPEGLLQGCYVVREPRAPWRIPALTFLLAGALVATVALLVVRLPAVVEPVWEAFWRELERWRALPERWQALIVWGGMALALALPVRYDFLPLAALAFLILVLLALYRLDFALHVPVFLIPFYLVEATLGGKHFSLLEVAVLGCAVAGGLRWMREGFLLPVNRAREGAVLLPALAFLLICTGSLFWSTDPTLIAAEGVSLQHISLREYRVVIVEPLLLYLLLRAAGRRDPGRVWGFADALVVSGSLAALGGLVQVFSPSLHAEVADGVRRATSVYGTFSANALALFLGRVLAVAIAGTLFLPQGRRKWLYFGALALMGAAFFLTYSRGGYLALAVVLLLYGLLRSRWLLGAEVGLGAAGALLAWRIGALGRVLALDTFRNRLTMWRNSWALVREAPWLGLGLDAFYHHYTRRYPGLEAYRTPHNVVLEFWTRLGLLGVAAGVWLYGTFFARGSRLYRDLHHPAARVLVLGLLGSVTYGLAHGLLDGAFFAPDWACLFWIALAIVDGLSAAPPTGMPAR